jgi:crotonobetainyl-CoA:carnitine CoA-transferase CaiB-like acyl-CoA transferase
MPGPLEGVKVVELGQMIAVPAATYQLATQGAEVIKVENAGRGDELRAYASRKNNMSAWYVNANSGKRSIGLDLQNDQGKEALRRILKDADVFIQGFRPGVVDRLGFGEAAVRSLNSSIVYCSSSGFGPEGPYAALPAYDPVIQAMTGWSGAQKNDGKPGFVRGTVADKIAALTAAQLVSAALVRQARTGEGQHIEMSMIESNLSFNWPDVMMHCSLQDDDAVHLPNMLQSYRLYACADGFVTVAAGTDKQWQSFCTAMERRDIGDDPRFTNVAKRSENTDAWYSAIEEAVQKFNADEVLDRLREADVPVAASLDPTEVVNDPQVKAMGLVRKIDHPVAGKVLQPRPSAAMFGEELSLSDAPIHGQHSREILKEVGFAESEIETMINGGAVAAAAED